MMMGDLILESIQIVKRNKITCTIQQIVSIAEHPLPPTNGGCFGLVDEYNCTPIM